VGMPLRYASTCPAVAGEVVASEPEPLPYRIAPAATAAQPVPPLPTGKTPVTSLARLTNAEVTTPETAFKMPLHEPNVTEFETTRFVVLATPVTATLELLASLSRQPPVAGLVIDVASVKVPIEAAGRGLPAFVPTHPLAGSQAAGPDGATAELFLGRRWMYVRPADSKAALRERVTDFIAAMGAHPIALDAATHDAIVALTSHLPQLVAVALAGRLGERPEVFALGGPGLASMTRLGSSPWSMWGGILAANAPAVAQEVRALVADLQIVAAALENGAIDEIEPWFERARAAVDRLGTTDQGNPFCEQFSSRHSPRGT